MQIIEVLNKGLYGHIKDGAQTTERHLPVANGSTIRELRIAGNNASFDLALSQEALRSIIPRLANQKLDPDDELNRINLPKVKVAVMSAARDAEKSVRVSCVAPGQGIVILGTSIAPKMVSGSKEFAKKCLADVKQRFGRVIRLLNEIAKELE